VGTLCIEIIPSISILLHYHQQPVPMRFPLDVHGTNQTHVSPSERYVRTMYLRSSCVEISNSLLYIKEKLAEAPLELFVVNNPLQHFPTRYVVTVRNVRPQV
jgi:hypothetical protein